MARHHARADFQYRQRGISRLVKLNLENRTAAHPEEHLGLGWIKAVGHVRSHMPMLPGSPPACAMMNHIYLDQHQILSIGLMRRRAGGNRLSLAGASRKGFAMGTKAFFAKSRTQFRRLRDDESGNVAPIFALALLPILGFVGAAHDYSRGNSIRTAMQAAIDGTALNMIKSANALTS